MFVCVCVCVCVRVLTSLTASAGRLIWMLPAPDHSPSQDAPVTTSQFQESAAEHASTAVDEEQRVWQRQPILLDVQKECFSRLLLLPEILTDHLPDTYLAAVQQL